MEPVIGIDLGTTNSEVAVCIDGKIEIVAMDDGSLMLPSVVGLDPAGKLIVGAEARNQFILYPDKTVRSIKRKMGSDEKISLDGRSWRPQEISAMILTTLKKAAEKRLGQPVSKAVITVPAQFNDAQRHATREAGQIAGLEVLRILNEPTAACLAYENDSPEKRKNLLAFDLGGGTFDVSVVRMERDVTEVIASKGDNFLGGDDFDKVIADLLADEVYQEQKEPDKLEQIAEYRLLKSAETAKTQLTEFAFVKIIESNLPTKSGKNESIDREFSRDEFNDRIQPFIDKALRSVRECLADANLKPEQIDDIILVGGSTRSPIFQDTIEQEFAKRPHANIQPDLAVAYGAGMMAARLMGEEQHRILVDITPYTFGISCVGMLNGMVSDHLFVDIIKSGSPLPTTREKVFYTIQDKQKKVEVCVFQGENADARKNILIGDFAIEGLSPLPANSEIVMSMKLDLDGVLRCTATEKATGKNKHISIANAMEKLSDEQISDSAKRIAKMFAPDADLQDFDDFDSEDDSPEAEVEIDSPLLQQKLAKLLRRLDKVRGKLDAEDSADAERLISRMQEAMADNDSDAFDESADELDDIIFFAES
jgi:molecular chaperone DnaK